MLRRVEKKKTWFRNSTAQSCDTAQTSPCSTSATGQQSVDAPSLNRLCENCTDHNTINAKQTTKAAAEADRQRRWPKHTGSTHGRGAHANTVWRATHTLTVAALSRRRKRVCRTRPPRVGKRTAAVVGSTVSTEKGAWVRRRRRYAVRDVRGV
jgi:hypothetical protein